MNISVTILLLALAAGASPESGAPVSPAAGEEAISAVVSGMNGFAFSLYRELAGKEGNIFFSPASLETALAMTATGAKGETAKQMNSILGLASEDRAPTGFKMLLETINNPRRLNDQPAYQMIIANALWGQRGYPFREDFIRILGTSFMAGLNEVDFKESEDARKIINTWVAGKTHDKIKNLVPPGAITALTRLVLTNAVYFKSNWAEPFFKNATKDAPFYPGGNKTVTVPMMRQVHSFGYLETGDLLAVELPYTGYDLSMVILLPRERDGLTKLEGMLTKDRVDGWLGGITRTKVDLSLPRFKFTSEFGMADTLEKLGMVDAFDPEKADFSGISSEAGLAISAVLHQAFVSVDEEGTEAAAATAVAMAGAAFDPEAPKIFKADHPFLFLIRHNRTGCILFLGRVVQPDGAAELIHP
ncbi:MAG: serpin family protein [PVC group bacterium]